MQAARVVKDTALRTHIQTQSYKPPRRTLSGLGLSLRELYTAGHGAPGLSFPTAAAGVNTSARVPPSFSPIICKLGAGSKKHLRNAMWLLQSFLKNSYIQVK